MIFAIIGGAVFLVILNLLTILHFISLRTLNELMCFFVFFKNPTTFDYFVNVFKKISKKYLRDRIYVKIP